MKFKNISYNNTHIPGFRKHIAWLAVFAVIAFSISGLQAFLLFKVNIDTITLNTTQTIASYACLIIGVVFLIFIICEMIKFLTIIKKIEKEGNITSKTFIYDFSSKFSFGNIFRLFQYIILLATSIFVIGLTTYGVLNYIYYTTVNFYLPICLMLLVTTFYAVKMLELQYEMEK